MIHNRHFKLEEPEKVPDDRTSLNIVYDQSGTVFCYNKASNLPERYPMAYISHEPDRGTIKHRRLARHQGYDCHSEAVYNY